ncbi:hypothetical protein ACTVH1_01645 [Gluconobacter cerinus]|uniref:hypothetical protein n=1 Tax=Gluconobacter TaxID=441 RepID=UPI001B8B440A|nr:MULTISPECIES: hypothetical protein [Gluconobacter]MBS0993223.1 hypothetical protein [Gluconobacter cerinus]MBS1021492.1 hypothetical protein [Gluconobacter cerinus]MBS1023757.1 hypothetical protein [Gluconobacter cerinus]MBS1044687.1 hypothetical protein [Gluconobacter cerinus]
MKINLIFRATPLAALICLAACGPIGPSRLQHDELEYSRALGESQKHEMLLNIVRLRYADPPTFLDTTQVIAGYSVSKSVSGGFYAYPATAVGNYLFGTGTMTSGESPTFTYQPVTGQQYAENIVRPISPTVIMPLSLGGLPIDTLLRLTAQSIDGLSNVRGLGAGPFGGGSVRFYLLLHDLRQLQIAGAMTIRITTDAPPPTDDNNNKKSSSKPENGNGQEHSYLVLSSTSDSSLLSTQAEVRRLLHLDAQAEEAEIVYGPYPKHPGQIAILTRSMLAMLTQLAYEVEVPEEDIKVGRTPPTIGQVGIENRPEVVIHSGHKVPDRRYAAVEYNDMWFWIDEKDFQSKLAFTMVQVLSALAATNHTGGAVVTIPAG